MESAADFGTGLRAHLGLEQEELALVAAPEPPEELARTRSTTSRPPTAAAERAGLEALEALETELVERERALAVREASLAGRAGALLAAAQALYDEVLGGGPSPATTSCTPAAAAESGLMVERIERIQGDRLKRWSVYVATPFVWLALACSTRSC